MAIYLLSEGKFDKIFLPVFLEHLQCEYCPLTTNDTGSLLKTDRDYYRRYQYIIFADNGRSDLYSKIIRRFVLSFFKKEAIQPIRVILFLDDDYSSHEVLNQTLLSHIRNFSYLIPHMEYELKPFDDLISLKISRDTLPKITIKVFYVPHSLERQIVQQGLIFLHNQKKSEIISAKDPHSGLASLSIALSCSIEETITRSVRENWLVDSQWCKDLQQLLKNPHFS
jgi:hypothetical protein